jgi:phosphatidylserine decarboxylase
MTGMSGARTGLERIAATAVSWPPLSRLVGRLADLRLPRPLLLPLIRAYVRAYGVDLSEAALPADAYPSFSAFFTRRLRAAARPIETEPGVVVSPSDSRLASIGRVPEDGRLEQVKGDRYSLEALLGSSGDAEALRGGQHATLYLSPSMYHRVHSPVDGRIVGWRYVPGLLFPVNAMGVRSVPGLFTRNERVVVLIETEPHGRVAVVLVGATNVGRIQLAFAELETNRGRAPGRVAPPQPVAVRRGDELGVFNLGSTVVLLVADPRLEPTFEKGSLVRVGQALWRRALGLAALALSASALAAAPAPPLKVRPGTLVRWPGDGIEWCAAGTERFEPLAGACIVPVDLLHAAGPLELRRQRAGRLETATVSVGRFDYPVQRLTLPRSMVELSREDLERVRRENREMARLWPRRTPRRFSLPLAAPLEPLPEGGHFGNRRVINGEARSPHGGVDFSADLGVPVRAAADGTVVMVGQHFFGGNAVFVDHGDGLVSQYFHLSKVAVAEGQELARGALIGEVGATGRATGPHLHFGIRWRGARVDPALLLAPTLALPCLDPPAGLGCRQ